MSEAAPINRIALVEDDEDLARSTAQLLKLAGFEVTLFDRAQSALDVLDADWPGVVVTDVRMPGISGIDLFRTVRERDAELPVVLITGHGDVDMAVDMLKSGAWDFLTKPFDPDGLVTVCARAIRARELALENRQLRALAGDEAAPVLLGQSPSIRRLREMIPMLANADIDILIEGETGTGKDLLARLIHRSGKRARRRFLPLPCAGMDEALVTRTFGPASDPAILAVDRGTLYLDDVDRAPSRLQDRLISFVEKRSVESGPNEVPLDFRIIATSLPLEEGEVMPVQPALFYRLAAMRLVLPPLRERREDVSLLFARFAAACAQRLGRNVPPLSDAVRTRLATHDWPGNVRELRNFAELFVMDLVGDPSGEDAGGDGRAPGGEQASLAERVDAFERGEIVQAVRATGGEIGAAIRALGLPRKTFYYKVAKHGIDLPSLKKGGG
ncbi:sigma-54-dependent transcriptional regulator [Novosphingobium decolorationis]|uniref:Sigma-54-dependent Fis family transcriptional regulator n=1 Tax=Novosphingobium decolorationis TaxID=2698673 RepID=A0ABX8E1H7_9SPHN|nr:sigma-54 dependent transcriptional regulator [Novosphingobium decolorationis]QVM82981.1 sigma-54-dependent Fis family transcriptional regulator [Novosphingobium decolorationis]